MAFSGTVDLRQLGARDLDPLLREETAEWARELDWDLSNSADIVRGLVEAHQLGGMAVVDRGEVAGYGYCGFANGKAQIWDVYVRPRWRGAHCEADLFRSLLDVLVSAPGVRRVESQMMLAPVFQDARLRSYERVLMTRDACPAPADEFDAARFRFEPWDDRHLDAAATALWLSHLHHVDGEMSDHYRSFTAARCYISDLVRFPACAFSREATSLAFDNATRQIAGMALASFVAAGVGHIAELCVMPQSRGAGLGRELLRRAIAALDQQRANRISLTVTACNAAALQLYQGSGFRESRRFYAYAWDRQPAGTP